MKRLLKVVSLVTVFVMVLSCSVFATTPAIQLEKPPALDKVEKTAEVSGKISNPVADSQVTLLVVESSASLSNLTDSNIAYVNQVSADEDGTFEFPLVINQEHFSGNIYHVYVGGTGVSSVEHLRMNFSTKPGDVTGEGRVTLLDYQRVVTNFGKKSWDGDATGEGKVTLLDYQLVVTNFGK